MGPPSPSLKQGLPTALTCCLLLAPSLAALLEKALLVPHLKRWHWIYSDLQVGVSYPLMAEANSSEPSASWQSPVPRWWAQILPVPAGGSGCSLCRITLSVMRSDQFLAGCPWCCADPLPWFFYLGAQLLCLDTAPGSRRVISPCPSKTGAWELSILFCLGWRGCNTSTCPGMSCRIQLCAIIPVLQQYQLMCSLTRAKWVWNSSCLKAALWPSPQSQGGIPWSRNNCQSHFSPSFFKAAALTACSFPHRCSCHLLWPQFRGLSLFIESRHCEYEHLLTSYFIDLHCITILFIFLSLWSLITFLTSEVITCLVFLISVSLDYQLKGAGVRLSSVFLILWSILRYGLWEGKKKKTVCEIHLFSILDTWISSLNAILYFAD